MVIFGLFGHSKNPSRHYKQSSPIQTINKSKDIIDELMDLDNINSNNKVKNNIATDFETSSFNLEEIYNRISNKNIDYKEALLNSLYSQVEFLKQELQEKNTIMKSLLKNTDQISSNSKIESRNSFKLYEPLYETINSSVDSSCDTCNTPVDDVVEEDTEFAPWEKYSTGFGSRMLAKMGYSGGGLGKTGSGIIKPIMISQKQGREAVGDLNRFKESSKNSQEKNRVTNRVQPWPEKTTLITGSSILNGIEESRLKKYKVKVRVFSGACVDDLYDYLTPLLKKKPSNIILQIGTNDALDKNADQIYNEIINLKQYIEDILPSVSVYLSCPVLRVDDSQANLVLRRLDQKLKCLRNIIRNDNVDSTCLGKRGLHLNPKGSGRLATNYISLLRRL